MARFIELTVTEDEEIKTELINLDCIGRIYPSPQNTRKTMVELRYHSINDAPVYLEVDSPYEALKTLVLHESKST